MGRGDKKTKKGKRWKGSYGVSRPRTSRNAAVIILSEEEKEAKAAKKAAAAAKKTSTKKAAPKKAAAKKTVAKKDSPKKAAPKKAAAKKTTSKKATAGDKLVKIEGIGPKISGILTEAGIDTFAKLADAKVDKLKELLAEAGGRYKAHDPTTWPQQSALAAADKWDELKVLQDELDGGKKK